MWDLGRTASRMLDLLRRVLNYQVSVAALIEVALWLAVPYITAGLVWLFFHPDGVQRIQTQLEQQFHVPAGSDYEVALGAATLLWPAVLLLPSDACAR
ncbi:hypothetical protein [Mycobacterium talmoniae]|uniref:hypothetical protein n=1 Tax=Mycobacterium talmoniae TaxID=1858794 RepID=UPI003BF8B37A